MSHKKSHKVYLELEEISQDPFLLIGLISPLSPYMLAFWLNRYLKVNFKRASDLSVDKIGKMPKKSFIRYEFSSQLHRFTLGLIANRQDDVYLSSAHKKLNYWMVINCQEQDDADQMMRNIVEIINPISPVDCYAVLVNSTEINNLGYFEQNQ